MNFRITTSIVPNPRGGRPDIDSWPDLSTLPTLMSGATSVLLVVGLFSSAAAQGCIHSYCGSVIDCPGCSACEGGICRDNPHSHYPHGHNPHSHNPHGHNPHSHHPHSHQPGPGPTPICEKGWPNFASVAELAASPWGAYFTDVYGALPKPAVFPLDTSAWWMLYDSLLTKHAVPLPHSAGKCAPPNCQLNLFDTNNAYSPASQWIWHPPPYAAFADSQWVEVMHERDPFGDEHNGAWFLYAKGCDASATRTSTSCAHMRNAPILRPGAGSGCLVQYWQERDLCRPR